MLFRSLKDKEVENLVCHFGIPSKSYFGGMNKLAESRIPEKVSIGTVPIEFALVVAEIALSFWKISEGREK